MLEKNPSVGEVWIFFETTHLLIQRAKWRGIFVCFIQFCKMRETLIVKCENKIVVRQLRGLFLDGP